MEELLPFIVVGIAGGSSYALLALGLVLTNNSSRILNFAQGEMGAFATFVVASLVTGHDLPWVVALPAGVVVGAGLGLATWWALLSRGARGKLPPLVGTIGVLSALILVEARYLGGPRAFPSPITGKGVELLGVIVSPTRMVVIGAVTVACGALYYLIRFTRVGLLIRAGADDSEAATIVGLRPARIEATAWTLAGVLAAMAGIFLAWIDQQISPGFLTLALPRAFAAVIVGGVTSMPGAIVGGLIVGVVESLTRKWFGATPGSPELAVFVILFLTLLLRPAGLFGRRAQGIASEATESLVSLHPLVAMPRPPQRVLERLRRRGWRPALAIAVPALLMVAISEQAAYRLSLIPIMAILALSLNSLLASTGQLSLGHVALLGVGAFMTGVAAETWDFPFALAVLVGALSTGAVALLLGVAALRVRGLYLAVMTLAFAVMLSAFVFPKPVFSRGGAGLPLDRPALGPLDLGDERVFLGFALAALALMWASDRRLLASPIGRAWVALRENEVAAMARGIYGPPLKVAAFVFSGLWAGVAGGLFGYRQGIVVSSSFPLFLSFSVILYVVIGGIGSRAGVAVATALFTLASVFGGSGGSDIPVLLGAVAVVVLIGRFPGGVGGAVRDFLARRGARDEAEVVAAEQVFRRQAGSAAQPKMREVEPAGPPLVEARDIVVRFAGLTAIDDVSIRVQDGEVVAIIGPNGAGKTTLFNTLSGFISPAQGSVLLGGREISGLTPSARTALGLGRTFQQGGLWLSETVLGNLLVAQHLSVPAWSAASLVAVGPRERAAELRRAALAEEVLAIVGLTRYARRPVADLPYGDRKVLELGCALMSRPEVLLLDEPAAGLGPEAAEWLGGVISSINHQLGIGILVIDHHVPLVKDIAHHVYVLNFGRLLAEGNADEVTRHPEVLEAYLGTSSRTEELATVAP